MTATLAVGSPEWIAERRTGLFGTDVARVLRVSKFGGPMSVYMEKRGLSAPLIETEAMTWGKLLEEPIAQEYARRSGRRVRRDAGFIRHPKYEWLGANIDRWSEKGGTPRRVLEVKTAGTFAASDFGEDGSDIVPADYSLQCQHYLDVTGKDVCDLAALIGGQRLGIYTIERDDKLIELMHEGLGAFWEDYQAGKAPEVDDSDATTEYLRLTYADKGTEREMDEELRALAIEYESMRLTIDEETARRKVVRNRIAELMGDNAFSSKDGVKVTFATVRGASDVQWAELLKARNIPLSVVDEFTQRRPDGRQVRVTIKD